MTLEEENPVQKQGDPNAKSGAEAEVSSERDQETEMYSRAATLLLAARERVLTLSEQRVSPSIVLPFHVH